MRKYWFGIITVFLVAALPAMPAGALGETAAQPATAIYQVSTINALLQGLYDGELTCGQLRQQGDLGIGTFDGLDGEMVVLDGRVLRVKADGSVLPVADEETIPFATVTFFRADQTRKVEGALDFTALRQLLDGLVVNRNLFYAFRIDGDFSYVQTRSVPRQTKPYPVLAEAAKQQSVFEMRNVQGTIVGFYCPPYVQGLNVPGYHLHFVSRDRSQGGHLLECTLTNGTIQAETLREFHMVLPVNPDFARTNLTADHREELQKVESSRE